MDNNKLNKNIPTLSLDPISDEIGLGKQFNEVVESKKEKQAVVEELKFTDEEKQIINDFVEKINIKDSAVVMQYGSGAQKKIADFSETALTNVKSKDLGEIGEVLVGMVNELNKFSREEKEKPKGFFGFLKRQENKVDAIKTKYISAEENIEKVCEILEGHQIRLIKDIAVLDKMYEVNKDYLKELSMYIAAGKKRLEKAKNEEIPNLINEAEKTGLQENIQEAKDYQDMFNRFEKKIHDLELTRMVSLQMAPQIRLVQNNDNLMAEKIQSSLVNTIPLWKSQMVLALGLANSGEAIKAQREVTDMTNKLLNQNAEMLKMETINTAKESERGIIDIETLKHTNECLISTFDEVLQIQADGREKRKSAEIELQKLESDLKQKMLELSTK